MEKIDLKKLREVDVIDRRVKLIAMHGDPHPIEPNSLGTVIGLEAGMLDVIWDNGRTLGLIIGIDEFEFVYN